MNSDKIFEYFISTGSVIHRLHGKRRVRKEVDQPLTELSEITSHLSSSQEAQVAIVPRGALKALDFDISGPIAPLIDHLTKEVSENDFLIVEKTNRGYHLWLRVDQTIPNIRVLQAGYNVRGLLCEAFGFVESKRALSFNPARVVFACLGTGNQVPMDLLPVIGAYRARGLSDFNTEEGWVAKEGFRNLFLQKMAGAVKNSVLVGLANQFCCVPPLDSDREASLGSWSEGLRQEVQVIASEIGPTLSNQMLDSLLDPLGSLEYVLAESLLTMGFNFLFKDGVWYSYNGKYWDKVDTSLVDSFIGVSFKRFHQEIKKDLQDLGLTRETKYRGQGRWLPDVVADFKRACKRLLNYLTTSASWSAVRTHLELSHEFLVKVVDGEFVGFEDGILDLTELKFLPHSPKYFTRHAIPCKFKEMTGVSNETKQWIEHLTENDPYRLTVLGLFARSCLKPGPLVPLFILTGPPRSSKTTLSLLATKMVGGQAATLTETLLKQNFPDEHILGKSLVIMPDVDPSTLNKARPMLKRMTGNDPYDIPRKFLGAVKHTPTAPVIVTANIMPDFSSDSAMIRRTAVIVCPKVQEIDPLFQKELDKHISSFSYIGLNIWRFIGNQVTDFGELRREAESLSPLTLFCREKLKTADSWLSNKDLIAMYGGEAKLKEDLIGTKYFSQLLRNVLQGEFGVDAKFTHTRIGNGLSGIGFRDPSEPPMPFKQREAQFLQELGSIVKGVVEKEGLVELKESGYVEFKNLGELPPMNFDREPDRETESHREINHDVHGGQEHCLLEELFSEAEINEFKQNKADCKIAQYLPKGKTGPAQSFYRLNKEEFLLNDFQDNCNVDLDSVCFDVLQKAKLKRREFWKLHSSFTDGLVPLQSVLQKYPKCQTNLKTLIEFTSSLGEGGQLLNEAAKLPLISIWGRSFKWADENLRSTSDPKSLSKLTGQGYFNKHFRIAQSVFPCNYVNGVRDKGFPNGYSRIIPVVGGTFASWERTHQSSFATLFSKEVPSFELVDIDMSSLHLTFAAHLLGEGSRTQHFVKDGSVWNRILDQVNLPYLTKKEVKLVVYRSLNGGNLSTIDRVKQFEELQLSTDQLNLTKSRLEETEFYRELNGFLSTLKGVNVFTPESCLPLPSKMPAYIRVSRILTGIEVIVFMVFDQVISEIDGMTPLMYTHDGITCLKVKQVDFSTETISKRLNQLLHGFLTLPIKVEIKPFTEMQGEIPKLNDEKVSSLISESWREHPDITEMAYRSREKEALRKYLDYLSEKIYNKRSNFPL